MEGGVVLPDVPKEVTSDSESSSIPLLLQNEIILPLVVVIRQQQAIFVPFSSLRPHRQFFT